MGKIQNAHQSPSNSVTSRRSNGWHMTK